MTYNTKAHLVFLFGCGYLMSPAPAAAQPVSAEPAQGTSSETSPATLASSENGLSDIVVTARKRQERLQDVPVAITALTQSALTESHVTNLTELGTIAPNVNISNFANFNFNIAAVIRGIGTLDFEPSSDPAVAIFVDGVYQSSTNGGAIDLFDLDSVQVLRGPQGTLFGRNSTAGAILINTSRPTGQLGMRAQLTVGNYGDLEERAVIDTPIVDNVLAAKVSVLHITDNGYYKNYDGTRLGKKDVFVIRPSLLFTPSPDLTVYLTGQYIDDHTQPIPGINGGTIYASGSTGASSSDYNTTVNSSNFQYSGDDKSITLNADLRAAHGQFTLISNYRDYGYSFFYDVDATKLTIINVPRTERHDQYSGELRYASKFSGPFNFVAGVLGSRQQYKMNYQFISDGNLFGGGPFGDGPGTTQLVVRSAQKTGGLSAYLNATIKVTDRLNAEIGGNYSYEKKNFLFFNSFAPGSPAVPAEKSWGNFGPKLGLNYRFSPAVLAYATYSRGFRSGGFNGRASFLADIGPYGVEKVDAYEIGVKSDLLDRRLRVNVSAFHNNFTGLQRPLNNPAFPAELITTNAANARIQGVEGEITARPVKTLTLGASLSYLDAKYTDYFSNVGGTGQDLTYLRLADAPKFQSHLFADLDFDLNTQLSAKLHGDYDHASSQFTDTVNSQTGFRRPTNLVNLSASVGRKDEAIRLGVYVRNLTKEVYVVSAQVVVPFVNEFTVNPPRTFGAELAVKF